MTPRQVKNRVRKVRALIDDAEAAHDEEDSLHQDVLRHIAVGQLTIEEAKELAYEALKTQTIMFARYCS